MTSSSLPAPMAPSRREIAFAAVFAFFFALAFILPPVAQPEAYHAFADERAFFGVPRFFDVASNLGFLLAGLWGLLSAWRSKASLSPAFFWAACLFFSGSLLTAFGSAFYHWAPDNARLVWDRLPMTFAFAGACSAIAAARVSQRLGFLTLAASLAAGAWSVWHWLATGDLTPYLVMQFGGLIWIAAIHFFGRSNPKEDFPWGSLLLFYGLAKAAELLDAPIYHALGEALSGHSVKHALAAVAVLLFAQALRRGRQAP